MNTWFRALFGDPWEFGMLGSIEARRHRRTGVVQMKRPLGWVDFHPDHWSLFVPNESEGGHNG